MNPRLNDVTVSQTYSLCFVTIWQTALHNIQLNTKTNPTKYRINKNSHFHSTYYMSHVQSSAGNSSTRCNIKFVSATYTVLTQEEDATSFHVQMRQSKCSEARMRHSFRCTFSSRFYTKRPHFNPTAFSNHYSYSRFFFPLCLWQYICRKVPKSTRLSLHRHTPLCI